MKAGNYARLALAVFALVMAATQINAAIVMNCSGDKTVDCSSTWNFDPPTAFTSCSNTNVAIIATNDVVTGVCPRVVTRTWLATDFCGNSNTCSQIITLQNTTPPVFVNPSLQDNLVPNPGFETYSSCPDNYSETARAVPWFQPTGGTSDFFHMCSTSPRVSVPNNDLGSQAPHGGQGYAGGFGYFEATNYVEYIEAPLQAPLISGRTYEVSFYVSRAEDGSTAAQDDLAVYFSVGSTVDYTTFGTLSLIPQVRNPAGNFLVSETDWMLIRGTFTAAGGEDHLMIGNFDDNRNTAILNGAGDSVITYYYIDDVMVNEPACPSNKTVQCGDSWSFDTPTAFDACSRADVPVTAQSTVTNGTCPQLITQTWVATDACGNSNTCSQTVTVLNAVTSCPSNIVVLSCTNLAVDYPVPATCCTNATVIFTPPSSPMLAPGEMTTVRRVVTDCCGHTNSCDFTIQVVKALASANVSYGVGPLTVIFSFQTPCPTNITNWRWDFGDGDITNVDTDVPVPHTYFDPGIFTPFVITSDDGGIDITNALPNPITVLSAFDAWRMAYFNCTNCLTAAPDSDPFGKGISNTNQFLAGLDPTNPASVFRIASAVRTGADVVITWKTAGVRTNMLQTANGGYGTDGFADIGGPIIIGVTGDTTANYTDVGAASNAPSRFYRVRLVP